MAVKTRLASASLLVLVAAAAASTGCSDDAADGASGTNGSGGNGPTASNGTEGAGGDTSNGQGNTGSLIVSNGSGCTPTTCEDAGATCGSIPDGCGETLDCGGADVCPTGETCQGNPPTCQPGGDCVPLTCETAEAECGAIADGCGDIVEGCGTCAQPYKCGGDGPPAVPNVCSIPESCTNLCLQQVDCEQPGVTTTVSGIVYAPGRPGAPAPPAPGSPDPLFDALVYIPNGPVGDFEPGVQCSQCGEEASGDPLVSARTDYQGRFVLENVPVGENIPLVIQLGRWRRVTTITNVAACVDTPLDMETTRLPRNQSEGNIPQIAISTGNVDALECVLRKIGVSDSEFTNPGGGGRIHLYQGAGAGGARINAQTPSETVLLDDPGLLDDYDMVLFPCQGDSFCTNGDCDTNNRATPQRQANLLNYTSAGGRVFATHFSYDWLHQNGSFADTAQWDVGYDSLEDQDGVINMGFPKGETFANWLVHVGASNTLGLMPVVVVRNNMDGVDDTLATEWMSTEDGQSPLHMTFNTPVGNEPEDQCGRVLFSDFHISNDDGLEDQTFPSQCDGDHAADVPMTPQEKLVEFMLFDLGSCLTPDIPVCTPFTCEDLGLECGPAADGCNGLIDCGDCPEGETCGGGGEPGVCGNEQCIPQSCEDQDKNCGSIGDGCGNVIDCGDCTGTQTCGGGGVANVCGGGIPG